MNISRVLALLSLFLGLAQCFDWDIVISAIKELEFYYNGTLTHTEEIPLAHIITSVTYDPVHCRVLFADVNKPNMSISSFNLSTRNIETLLTRQSEGFFARIVYDPVTQIIFWKEHSSIYSYSLKPGSSNEAVDGNLLVSLENVKVEDLAVESFGEYIYWITKYEIERARFDGSEREILIDNNSYNRLSLAIDEKTQKMYWYEQKRSGFQRAIESADLNGMNRKTVYVLDSYLDVNSLAVTKDFIYWKFFDQATIWQLPKNLEQDARAHGFLLYKKYCPLCRIIAANYATEEKTEHDPMYLTITRLLFKFLSRVLKFSSTFFS